jgi:hypothetical protein
MTYGHLNYEVGARQTPLKPRIYLREKYKNFVEVNFRMYGKNMKALQKISLSFYMAAITNESL